MLISELYNRLYNHRFSPGAASAGQFFEGRSTDLTVGTALIGFLTLLPHLVY